MSSSVAAASAAATTAGDDPEKLLNEWLGQLETIIGDLDLGPKSTGSPQQPSPVKATLQSPSTASSNTTVVYRNRPSRSSEFNRFSMANLEDTQETELDAILGELSQLEMEKQQHQKKSESNNSLDASIKDQQKAMTMYASQHQAQQHSNHHQHQRSNSIVSSGAQSIVSLASDGVNYSSNHNSAISNHHQQQQQHHNHNHENGGVREPRTESPDNDSAFSDTVSLLSSDTSSTSSGLIHNAPQHLVGGPFPKLNQQEFDNQKAAKIHLALQKLEQASVRRLFVKAFTVDGASKSLLVDETMTCGHVTRLLSDKNHVQMETHWALVEQLPDIQMERLYEDHELLVDKLMMWNRDSKNKILFVERPQKVAFFVRPELFIGDGVSKDVDECNRNYMLEEFFTTNSQIPAEGPLYLKADSKRGWKRYHFVLRGSGLYYYAKEKTRLSRDLVCLSLFNDAEVYQGFGWRKRYKAPTDHTFVLHSSQELANSKNTKPLKILCADDAAGLAKWILAIRIAKYGKQLWQSFRALREELARDDFDQMSTRRSSSINSISGVVAGVRSVVGGGVCGGDKNGSISSGHSSSSGRLSRASSSSSSGCLSDENNGFDTDFPTGTIKRKPSMKPNLPLTSMTRQLIEVGENRGGSDNNSPVGSPERGGTLTRRSQNHIRQRSVDSGGSVGSGTSTLKRRPVVGGDRKELLISGHAVLDERVGTPSTLTKTTLVGGGGGGGGVGGGILSPLKSMPSCMTDSVFSLPPPPPEDEYDGAPISGSMLSLDSLPPPPTANELEESLIGEKDPRIDCTGGGSRSPSSPHVLMRDPIIYTDRSLKKSSSSTLTPSPPSMLQMVAPIYGTATSATTKLGDQLESCLKKQGGRPEKIYSVPSPAKGIIVVDQLRSPSCSSSIGSPVTLRKKVCFEDQVVMRPQSPTKRCLFSTTSSSYGSVLPPKPPPRAEATRLSTQPPIEAGSSNNNNNNNNDFLKDLQRVMRKKWQVAQKCKLEPDTSPHEVLGFRDFAWQQQQLQQQQDQLPFYRETANVSHWVREHYGPDSLYENLGVDASEMQIKGPTSAAAGASPPPAVPTQVLLKKRPPPLPPKRSETTQLTTSQQQQQQMTTMQQNASQLNCLNS